MGVNSLPKTVTRQGRDCDFDPGPSAPESSTLTTRLPSHASLHSRLRWRKNISSITVVYSYRFWFIKGRFCNVRREIENYR